VKHSAVLSVVVMALALGACDRTTNVAPASVMAIPVPQPASSMRNPGVDRSPTKSSYQGSINPSPPVARSTTATEARVDRPRQATPLAMTKQEKSLALLTLLTLGRFNDGSSAR
jgi:hypothetical protein